MQIGQKPIKGQTTTTKGSHKTTTNSKTSITTQQQKSDQAITTNSKSQLDESKQIETSKLSHRTRLNNQFLNSDANRNEPHHRTRIPPLANQTRID